MGVSKMDLIEDLQRISEGKMPKGTMLVRTTHGSSKVGIYGTNQRGRAIPLDKIDEFISELEEQCKDPRTLYVLGEGNKTVEIPGFKVSGLVRYLKQARDVGVKLAEYNRIF